MDKIKPTIETQQKPAGIFYAPGASPEAKWFIQPGDLFY